jgi:hypothetical protein
LIAVHKLAPVKAPSSYINTQTMRSLTLATLLGLAPLAMAEGIVAGVAPAIAQPAAVVARQDDNCASSVFSALQAGPTPDSQDLLEYIAFNPDVAACTVTAPASLSSEYVSWMDDMTEWAKGLEKSAHKLPKCGYETLSFSITGVCPRERTVYFEDESGDDVATETYDPLPIATDIHVGAAPRNTFTIGAGVALAGFVAVALAL